MKRLLIMVIKSYQHVISPLFGNSCRFYPTCSQYSIEALEKRGALFGSWMSLKRLIRCGPWTDGGFDPVP